VLLSNVSVKNRLLGINPLVFFSVAYSASAALQKGLGFLLFMWLAHYLSVEDYAKFGLLYSLQAGVAGLAAAGIIEVVIGFLKSHESKESRAALFGGANTVFAWLSLICLALVALGSGLLMRLSGTSLSVLFAATIAGLLTAYFAMQSQLIRLEEKHSASLALNFFPPVVGLLGGTICVLTMQSVAGFFVGFSIGLLASLVPFNLLKIGFYGFVRQPHQTLPIIVRIVPFIPIAVLGWGSGYGNTYLVQSFFTPLDVARFTFAYSLSSIMQLVATSLNQVWSPRVFKLIHEIPFAEVEMKNRRFYMLQGMVLGVVGAVVLLATPMIIQLSGSGLEAYSGLTQELFFLFLAYGFSIPWYHAQNYYFVHSKGKELMHVTLASSLVGVFLWLLSIWVFGPIGVYVGVMLLMTTRTFGALIWARREWPIRILWEGPVITLVMLLGALSLTPFVLELFSGH
jgi:O-antigen/teichoic acid export membrane protein